MFKVDNQQGPCMQHMELCSMLRGSLDGRSVGGKWIYIYIWLSSFAVHLKLSSHCLLTGYTPLQIKSLITSKHMISNSFLGRNGKLHKFRYHIQIIIKVRQIEDIIYFIHQYKAKITKFHLKIFLVGQTLTFYQALHLSASSSSLQPVSFSITLY